MDSLKSTAASWTSQLLHPTLQIQQDQDVLWPPFLME